MNDESCVFSPDVEFNYRFTSVYKTIETRFGITDDLIIGAFIPQFLRMSIAFMVERGYVNHYAWRHDLIAGYTLVNVGLEEMEVYFYYMEAIDDMLDMWRKYKDSDKQDASLCRSISRNLMPELNKELLRTHELIVNIGEGNKYDKTRH